MLRSWFALLGVVFAGAAACVDADGETTTASQPSTSSDLADASDVVHLLRGGPGLAPGRCTGCHVITAATVRRWGTAMQDVETACFRDDGRPPAARIDCLRDTTTGQATFSPQRLGLYAAGANSAQFVQLFDEAGASDDYLLFQWLAGMPRSGDPLTAEQFAQVKAWVLRGMPALDAAFDAPSPP